MKTKHIQNRAHKRIVGGLCTKQYQNTNYTFKKFNFISKQHTFGTHLTGKGKNW